MRTRMAITAAALLLGLLPATPAVAANANFQVGHLNILNSLSHGFRFMWMTDQNIVTGTRSDHNGVVANFAIEL